MPGSHAQPQPATMVRKCFVCCDELEGGHSLTSEQSSVLLHKILEISDWANSDVHSAVMEFVCYCGDCFDKITKLVRRIHKLESLEGKIRNGKDQLKSQLKETCQKFETNFNNTKTANCTPDEIRNPKPHLGKGMLQTVREQVVKELDKPKPNFCTEAKSTIHDASASEENHEIQEPFSAIENLTAFKKLKGKRSKSSKDLNLATAHENQNCPNSKLKTEVDEIDEDRRESFLPRTSDLGIRSPLNDSSPSGPSSLSSRRRGRSAKTQLKITDMIFADEKPETPKKKFIKSPPPGKGTSSAPKSIKPSLQPKKCKYCGKTLSGLRTWRNHVAVVHHRNFKFSCELCNFGCLKNSDLQRHMPTHFERRDFPCDECTKTFKTKLCLQLHKKVHLIQLRRQCELCSQKFMTIKQLQKHELSKTCPGLTSNLDSVVKQDQS